MQGKKTRSKYKEIRRRNEFDLYNIDDEKLDILVQKKNEFSELRNDKIEGVMLRS